MEIVTLQLIEGARQARGLAVVIDVFRAFSLECYVMANGAARIYTLADAELAYQLKRQHPDYVLMGERNMKKLPGFDFGNSPAHIEHVDFTAKTVVHTTSAGTQGIANAVNADEIITGSFVNARAVADYIRRRQPQQVSLVCMGNAGIEPTEEDTLCAQYIRQLVQGIANDEQEIANCLRHGRGRIFFQEESQDWAPSRDFTLCMQFDRFPFVLRVEQRQAGVFGIAKVDVEADRGD